MDSQIDDFINALQKHGVRRITFTLTEQMEPIVVVNQAVTNRSRLQSEFTHAHTGKTYADACQKIQRDVEHASEIASKIISLNSN